MAGPAMGAGHRGGRPDRRRDRILVADGRGERKRAALVFRAGVLELSAAVSGNRDGNSGPDPLVVRLGHQAGPGFRLYNVSGLDAVELRLKSGDIRRIGTDDPQALADALKAHAPVGGR
jgi:hypothetical protein